MDRDTIQHMFEQLIPENRSYDESAHEFFSLLVKATLDYRDEMLASRGVIVTVDDVKTSLRWLIPALATGNIPDLENEVCLELLKTWISQLRTRLSKLS